MRLLNGTGEQFFCWCILSPAPGFQNSDYAEDQNCGNHDTEQSPASRAHPGHKEEVTHWSAHAKRARFASSSTGSASLQSFA
jgi:hypothetical protein